ncbi:DUF2306 domain-containing protein [Janthinobacterium sp. B9-8]|uniref:DUF2306 domain-containing protein n=1 Tax=Janthinobacterium sp. B9-8 TaxID=1236179 RepID=UPI00069B31C5|nr:DUF2306 domain-containing protein [Janthinobacterium sp. B9-8]AMC33828.1 hypothetical protein VN23_04045 [Janthinobacterium sp. B9-8]
MSLLYLHIVFALAALLMGAAVLCLPKGSPRHRLMGRTWMALMGVTAISSFGLSGLWAGYRFSPIHLLSVWVLICIVVAIRAARAGQIKRHRRFVLGSYLGLLGAGAATLLPGRLIYTFLFAA